MFIVKVAKKKKWICHGIVAGPIALFVGDSLLDSKMGDGGCIYINYYPAT